MTKNEAPRVSLRKRYMTGTCDGCEETLQISATDDGRTLMCDECRDEYNEQMAE
jgi:hypothetical protein